MSDRISLPVGATVLAAWRQFAARPDYVLHVAWIPALLVFAVGALSGVVADGPPVADFWMVVLALLNFAVLVQALVAWQRYALPQSHPRKGLTGLRAGRAEFFSLLHFPLVGVLFVPLLIPTLIESLTATQEVADGTSNVTIGLAGLALLVFPGGLLLLRTALMLTAIAAAGKTRISLIATANRVWSLGAGNSIRLLLVFYLTVLPAALAYALLPDDMPALARTAANGVLLALYVMLCGGALAGAYGQLAAGSGKSGKTAS
jgi:hypothetical protein